ncbi:Asparagine synthetase [Labilithrix luteola]|uniref:asparagine synthase (glutamine-hydrolyzing) n=1 Tax=Labilithrix luteola TaxID=1391654 RepID=A0A0K1Q664_9BACT|nr:asparagine synthase (glutamine-hydrolyzing) [Labilithrix luteola]AKV01162.1 Asparagine synthetase [Labilithrix luteola]
MCGIVGLLGETPSVARNVVTGMAGRIVHRGPDGGGVLDHPDATIGMRRLAIVDVAQGHQPMVNEDGSVALVYNGEIYNAPKLREELIRQGVHFRTRSDTEVILRLYERDPESVERDLVGMWAFCIHDRRRRRAVLSRDRFGIKPLFIATNGRHLAFASELQAFDRTYAPLASKFELDRDAAHAMLAWGYVPENATIFRGVERLSPGHRFDLDLTTGTGRTRAYWSLTPSIEAARVRSLDDACDLVESALRRAVHEHLESDVPLATFLSGGIDSSLITAYAAEKTDLRAYTIGFREPRFDESPHAKKTAERIGVPLQVETLDEDQARQDLANALLAYDEPFGDSSSLATYMLCRHVSRDYKVALGGDGGDEVFAGYAKYRMLRARRWIDRVPGLRRLAHETLSRLPSRTDRSTRIGNLLRVASKASRGLARDDAEAYVALTELGTIAQTAKLVRGTTQASRFERLAVERFDAARGSALQRTAAADLFNPLPNDMLTKVDRASMAFSLEARVPFLDHRVVELGVGLPERFTLGTNGKRVLRALHERRFGRELAQRGKWGFGVPVEKWLTTSLASACDRLFERSRLERFGLLEPSELSSATARRAWLERDPILLWHAFALAAWCEAKLGDGPDALREVLGSPPSPRASSPARSSTVRATSEEAT